MIKHNKIKNTGLIFEILSRLVMRETLDNKNTALSIVKRHFKTGSELVKELKHYQTLQQPSEHNNEELLKLTLEGFKNLNKSKLNQEKYNLVKSINKNYNPDVFFQTKTSNYKLTASIFKLLEYNGSEDPNDYLNCKKLVLENLNGKKINEIQETEQIVREQDKDTRILAFKIIVERFNKKYNNLNEKQRILLQKYINEDISKSDFKDFIMQEVGYITNTLTKVSKGLTDEITKIKLNETIQLAQNIVSSKTLKEEHLNAMLKYYQLIEDLK